MGTYDDKKDHTYSDDEDRSLNAKDVDSDNTTMTTQQLQDSFSQDDGADDSDGDSRNDGNSSDLGYSDDSASLSDAYFFPQREDLGKQPPSDSLPLLNHQTHYYGSTQDRSTSPLWMAGPLQEDVEMKEVENGNHSASLMHPSSSAENLQSRRRERRKRRRLQRQNQQQQRGSLSVVTQEQQQIQQPHRWKDKWFAVLFLVQLALVCLCSLRYGVSVLLFRDANTSWTAFGKFRWQQQQQKQQDSAHRLLTKVVVQANVTDSTYTNNMESISTAHSDAHTDDFVDLNEQPSTFVYKNDSSFTIDYHNVIALVGITGFYACVLTYLSFGFMLILARSLIQIMLVFSILLSLAWGMVGLYLDPYGVISVMGFSALLLTLGHVSGFTVNLGLSKS